MVTREGTSQVLHSCSSEYSTASEFSWDEDFVLILGVRVRETKAWRKDRNDENKA